VILLRILKNYVEQGACRSYNVRECEERLFGDQEMAKRKETVTRVIDGDTFLTKSRKRSVRLADVDAPERGRKGSSKATQALKKLIQGKKVEVDTVARDAFGRAVAKVKVGKKSVNRVMAKKLKR